MPTTSLDVLPTRLLAAETGPVATRVAAAPGYCARIRRLCVIPKLVMHHIITVRQRNDSKTARFVISCATNQAVGG